MQGSFRYLGQSMVGGEDFAFINNGDFVLFVVMEGCVRFNVGEVSRPLLMEIVISSREDCSPLLTEVVVGSRVDSGYLLTEIVVSRGEIISSLLTEVVFSIGEVVFSSGEINGSLPTEVVISDGVSVAVTVAKQAKHTRNWRMRCPNWNVVIARNSVIKIEEPVKIEAGRTCVG